MIAPVNGNGSHNGLFQRTRTQRDAGLQSEKLEAEPALDDDPVIIPEDELPSPSRNASDRPSKDSVAGAAGFVRASAASVSIVRGGGQRRTSAFCRRLLR